MELLLVIGVVGILSSIVIVAVNPAEQLRKARDTQRENEAAQIQKALEQYYVKNNAYPASVLSGWGNSYPICQQGQTDTSCINIDALIPDYIGEIPVDPTEEGTLHTGYEAYQDTGRPFVIAPRLGEVFPVDYIARWRFTESASPYIDSTGNGNNATCTSTCPASSGVSSRESGFGVQFENPSGEYLIIDSPLLGETEITVCAWVYKVNHRLYSTVFSDYSSISRNFILFHESPAGSTNSRFYIGREDGESATSVAKAGVDLNEWSHICGVYIGDTSARSYVDGEYEETSLSTSYSNINTVASNYARIGSYANSYTFRGIIDDVRAYNRALSEEEIQMLYNEGPTE